MTEIRLRCRTCGITETFDDIDAANSAEWYEKNALGSYKGDGIVEHPAFCSEGCEAAY